MVVPLDNRLSASALLALLVTLALTLPQGTVSADEAHAPIIIHGDTQLTDAAAQNGWPGSGTPTDPYRIEHLVITANAGAAIALHGTTRHVLVQHNTLSGDGLLYGIELAGARNVRVHANTIHDAAIGILLNVADATTVSDNTVHANAYGIAVLTTQNARLTGNSITGATTGIALLTATQARLEANTVTGPGQTGIELHNGARHDIVDNHVSGQDRGLRVRTSPLATIARNTVTQNDIGATIQGTATTWTANMFQGNRDGFSPATGGQTLTGNTFTGNDRGVVLTGTHAHILTGNTYTANRHGIDLLGSHDNTFTGETLRGNTQGLYAFNSQRNTIQDTQTDGDATSIHLRAGRDNVVSGGHFANATTAIWYEGLRDATIQDATFIDNDIAIRLHVGSDNRVHGNTLLDNAKGLRIDASEDNTIHNNRFANDLNVEISGNVANTWSIPPTTGPNILGGPLIAGNAWNDYTGVDLDGDGLGELPHSLVPYGGRIGPPLAGVSGQPYGPEDDRPLVPAPLVPLP